MSSNILACWKKSNHSPAFWRATIALAFSIMLHLFVLGGLDFRLPALEMQEDILEVLFVPAAIKPDVRSGVPDQLDNAHVSESKPTVQSSPQPVPQGIEDDPVMEQESVTPPEPPILDEYEPVPENIKESVIAQEETESEEPLNEYPQEESALGGIVLGSEAYIETEFDLRRSADGGTIGTSKISFRQFPDGSYTLVSTTEAKGLMSLFLPGQLIQKSEGIVTGQGLQPEQFTYLMTGKDDKTRRARFDWGAGELILETSKGINTVDLLEGTQDLLSFMYQFVFVPPLEIMEIPITNGKKLGTYSYAFEGEEELVTKIGNVRTLHIARSSGDGDEKTEIWLAVDYQYMPVKIRKTEEDGSVIEQIVTNLSTDILK